MKLSDEKFQKAVQTGVNSAMVYINNWEKNNGNLDFIFSDLKNKYSDNIEKNTALLMENYKQIAKACGEIEEVRRTPMTSDDILAELLLEVFDNERMEYYLQSDERTLLLFSHLEEKLNYFERVCVSNGDKDSYDILFLNYVQSTICQSRLSIEREIEHLANCHICCLELT